MNSLVNGVNYGNLFAVTLPETILEIVSLLVLVVDLGWLRKSAQSTRMAAACVLGVLGCLSSVLWLSAHPQTASLATDALAATPLVAAAQIGILILTALVLLLSVKAEFSRNPGEYAAIVLLSATGMLLVTAARDLLIIFVALELLSLSLYVLTAFAKSSAQSAESALKYYLFGGMSAAMMLFGFSYLYGLTGSTNLSEIATALASQSISPLLVVALVLVAAGLGFKIAAVPFHLWAPDTYQGAPTQIAALIASGSKVASFSVLIALTDGVLGSQPYGQNPPWIMVLVWMAFASIVLGNLAALVQTSVRRLLAYSAIAHAGYMLLGIAAHTPQSSASVLYYTLTYALTIIGAFGVISIVERSTGSDKLDAFAGLSRRNPLLAGSMLIFLLSLAGIPPLVGFWAKFNLFASVLRSPTAGHWGLPLVALALGASAISLFYYLQVLKRVYVVKSAQTEPLLISFVELATLVIIALAVALLGVFPSALSGWIPLG
ncbi:NADH-quinone oxidoreductase subunit N [Acidicapsa acidisoli]|uniref:NADH-quinone oxidoreductase subunit N n=1 Tax=Acidicapsa acidisoli TaxID=1615681 RepID=UPI0021E088AA|nr:NADH-quinone oxidoreductase subunit N [Acidicapsa acidisoli]